MEEAMEVMVDTEAIAMARERLKMMPSQAKEVMVMSVMVLEEAMAVFNYLLIMFFCFK